MGESVLPLFDPKWTEQYFDTFAEKEWERHDSSVPNKVSFVIHSETLANHIRPGMRVLDIGAGPGRFTQQMVLLGAKVCVVDRICEFVLRVRDRALRD
jgi:2-polyprenyl-3-methyl-5-hydroxy-6-metoxy-1,4-benzoquinol methylase